MNTSRLTYGGVQWEYVSLVWRHRQTTWVVLPGETDRDSDQLTIMNRLGAQGWDLVGISSFANATPDYYFKRPKPSSDA